MQIFSILIACFCYLSTPSNDIVGKWLYEDEQGKLVFEFKDDLTYAIDFDGDGSIDIQGVYTLADGKMTVKNTQGNCLGDKGIYAYSISGSTMTVTKVSDECEGRGGNVGESVEMKKL